MADFWVQAQEDPPFFTGIGTNGDPYILPKRNFKETRDALQEMIDAVYTAKSEPLRNVCVKSTINLASSRGETRASLAFQRDLPLDTPVFEDPEILVIIADEDELREQMGIQI